MRQHITTRGQVREQKMAAERESDGEAELQKVFERGWQLFVRIENSDGPTISVENQENIKSCIKCFENSTNMVNILGMFSRNEQVEEVSSTSLRYLLLPAFMGELTLLQQSDDRYTDVSKAKIYLTDFLQRCKDYSITDLDLSQFLENDDHSTRHPNHNRPSDREAKINRYKHTKELKSKISKLEERLKNSPGSVDEEIQREYYLSWIRLWINESVEKLSLIKSELEILEHMANLKSGKIKPEEKPKPKEPIKPILITKESLRASFQAKVFGAGYPSLPSMTPEQWMDKQIAEGKVVLDYNPNVNSAPPEKDSDDEDEDDEEKLKKARDWDEWKDDHKRGEGNRKDRG